VRSSSGSTGRFRRATGEARRPDGRRRQVGAFVARTRAELPAGLGDAIEVYLNGVLQHEGRDYRREGEVLLFDRELAREGRLGFWRWTSMLLGVAGTYRRNDSVDVVYERGGRRQVATGLPLRALE
jgi:hypothetical protein